MRCVLAFGCISFDSYIKPQLITTVRLFLCGCISFDSYIKPQLSMRPIESRAGCISFDSYIKPQPIETQEITPIRCISFDSYIKPQLSINDSATGLVVYLLIPTSNHNSELGNDVALALYIF